MKKITNQKNQCAKLILLAVLCAIGPQAYSQWSLTGNSGTIPGTNFIGTTDSKSFYIKTKNSTRIAINSSGRVGIGTTAPVFKLDVKGGSINTDSVYRIVGNTVLSVKGSNNLFAGINSGFSHISGSLNTAIGTSALYSNTTGGLNTVVGFQAMYFNTTGASNTSIGVQSLYSNKVGYNNTAMGLAALYSNSSGYNNTAIGYTAMYFDTSGYNNTAVGFESLNSNKSGRDNTSSGYQSLKNNLADNNTAFGSQALVTNSIGYQNTAFGYRSLFSNVSGDWNVACGPDVLFSNSTGYKNIALGLQALYSNNTGSENVAIGIQTMYGNSSGDGNVAIGGQALNSNDTGSYNIAIAWQSLYFNNGDYNVGFGAATLFSNTTGHHNSGLGHAANVSAGTFNHATAIGASTTVNASNKVRLGDAGVNVVEGQVGYSWPSDGRFKENIIDDVKGLDFILKLKPVSYNFNRLKFAQHVKQDLTPQREKTLVEESQKRSVGFIAQDVEKIILQTGFTSFDAVHAPTNETDNYSMGYAEFVVPLVKAVQELNVKLELENAELKKRIEALEEKSVIENKNKNIQINNGGALLEQNSPNPFNSQSKIKFMLPSIFNSAQLIITDSKGKQIRKDVLKNSSFIIIKASELASGTYAYTLVIDGVNVDSKQMILTK